MPKLGNLNENSKTENEANTRKRPGNRITQQLAHLRTRKIQANALKLAHPKTELRQHLETWKTETKFVQHLETCEPENLKPCKLET